MNNLERIGTYRYSPTKQFDLYQDDKQQKYIKKSAHIKDYPLLKAIAKLGEKNPCIGLISDFSVKGDKVSYFVKLYEGSTLEKIIHSKTTLSVNQVKTIINNIGQALEMFHQINIIHRDVKPANIIITKRHAILIDYDICRSFDEQKNQDTEFLGTKTFASPEQYGFNQTTNLSDIYSFGRTIEELVTNCLKDEDHLEFALFIKKATMLDPKDRFQTVNEMVEFINQNYLSEPIKNQLNNIKRLDAKSDIITSLVQQGFDDKAIGVIKHAIKEAVNPDVIELMMSDAFTSRQLWQIKKGAQENLTLNELSQVAKKYLSPEEMQIIRENVTRESKEELYTRLKVYLIVNNSFNFVGEDSKKLAHILSALDQSKLYSFLLLKEEELRNLFKGD